MKHLWQIEFWCIRLSFTILISIYGLSSQPNRQVEEFFSYTQCKEGIIDSNNFIAGELFIYLEGNYFDFPLEAYAAHVSFDSNEIVIMDSIIINHIRPGTKIIETEEIVSYKTLSSDHPNIYNKIRLNFNKNIVSLFKQYGVYYISRGIKSFSPQDTLPHYIQTRRKGKVLRSRPNYNKSLIIKFKNISKTNEFAEELIKIKGIRKVQLHEKVMEFSIPTINSGKE